ncbi:MAG: CSLREA domain-containing protein [Ahniella sp.]|nr:CSLREA domain-containing protein [Ahniella sp.]
MAALRYRLMHRSTREIDMLRMVWNILLLVGCGAFMPGASAAVFIVNEADDLNDGTCNTTHCSLREAITAANAGAGADIIAFDIELPIRGDLVIRPSGSALPTITAPVTIDGYTQTGTDANTAALPFSNADLRIRIDGAGVNPPNVGLAICANNVVIQGIAFTGWTGASRFGVNYGRNNAAQNCGSALTGAVFRGNFVGLSGPGNSAVPNQNGLSVRNTAITIGSAVSGHRNVFANNAVALSIGDSSAASSVTGNLFGTNKSGTVAMPNLVSISPSADNLTIGSAAAPNYIRFGDNAIRPSAGIDNSFEKNHMFDTEFPAISLTGTGQQVTANDPDDVDTGPNGRQNFPVVNTVARIAGGIRVTGTLDVPTGAVPQTYRLAAYASIGCHSSAHGPGESFLGTADVNLVNNGGESFSIDITGGAVPIGSVLTMTATGPDGTSEFSACTNIDDVVGFAVNSANDLVDAAGCDATHCSLREAINAANTRPGPDAIRFAIPVGGTGEILITLASGLPEVAETLTIDGYTQAGTSVNTDPVASNAVLRIHVTGSDLLPERIFSICAPDVVIRGLSLSGANASGGPSLQLIGSCAGGDTSRFVLAGNQIGLAADGITAAPIQTGVGVAGPDSLIGGVNLADRNVFAGGTSAQLTINENALDTQVLGNLFGTDKSGTLDRGGSLGIQFRGGISSGDLNLKIGSATAPNRFRFNALGINARSDFNPGPADFAQNTFANHDGIAINLGNSVAVTPNDTNDVDSGANEGQNFPVLSSVFQTPTGIEVTGSLDVGTTVNNEPFTLAFFANTACDASGHGEAELLLGVVSRNFTQTTGESFTVQIDTPDPISPGTFITAIATGAQGSSELSACRTVSDAIEEYVVNTTNDVNDGVCNVSHCSLREAINTANATIGPQTIAFDITGAGARRIELASALPVIVEALVINGYTQPGSSGNSEETGSNAVIGIEVDANNAPNIIGTCTDERVEVRGLALVGASGAAIHANQDEVNCVGGETLLIAGNFFGLSADGSAGTNGNAVVAWNQRVAVGGGPLPDRNVFGNSAGDAIRIEAFFSGSSSIKNNIFGLAPDGLSPRAIGGSAVTLTDVSSVAVGGIDFEANTIRHAARGVVVKRPTSNTRLNSLFGNTFANLGGMAIDLSATGSDTDGITPNDADDADAGPNDLQNSPELTSVTLNADTMTVEGLLRSGNPTTELTEFTLYLNDACASASAQQAQQVLARVLSNTSASAITFSADIPSIPPGGPYFITATAHKSGNTSELSNCMQATVVDTLFKNSFE